MGKNTGGLAFPRAAFTSMGMESCEQDGMTLRQWYAGMALQGVMQGARGFGEVSLEERKELLKNMAGVIFLAADAMIAEDAKETA